MTESMNPQQKQKHLPPFWRTLKHPSSRSTPPPRQDLKSLTEQQRATYNYLFETINSRDFELQLPSSSPEQGLDEKKLSETERLFCSQECLLRFCRATKWDQNRALKRLIETLIWRREFQVDQIDYRSLSHEAETGKQYILGYDNHQRPLLYMFPYRQNTKPSIDQIRLLVWYLERTIDLMPPGVETLTLMIDFGDSSKSNKFSPPTPLSMAKEVLKILQTYYCERLDQAICINVPWMFWGFLKVLKPFVDPKTAEKILFDPVVTDYIPAEQLQKDCFHGDLDFQYDHETYFPLLAGLTAIRRQKMLARYRRRGGELIGMSEYELRGGNSRKKRARQSSVGSISSTGEANDFMISSRQASPSTSTPNSPGIPRQTLKALHKLIEPSGGALPMVEPIAEETTTDCQATLVDSTEDHTSGLKNTDFLPASELEGSIRRRSDRLQMIASRPLSSNAFSDYPILKLDSPAQRPAGGSSFSNPFRSKKKNPARSLAKKENKRFIGCF